ncbi:hypothetical protein K2X85_14850, partial [bacterium]|nr:hypothetical protein [bacterium]
MNASLFHALFWKEFRQIRGIWLAVLSLGLLIIFLVDVTRRDPETRGIFCFLLLLMFCVGSLAISFTAEDENGTQRWLVGLGIPAVPLVFTKILVSLIGAILLWAILFLCDAWLHVPGVDTKTATENWIGFSSLGFCVFCHALVWTNLQRQVLMAAASSVLSSLLVSARLEYMIRSNWPDQSTVDRYAALALIHVGILLPGILLAIRRFSGTTSDHHLRRFFQRNPIHAPLLHT